mmetsp:Transcript_3966/g.5172  ORF Transcript_3966/g.5172 Transcript_3966/m.5172 type:complete len:177 (+) Transcript_3966:200-730(+)
MKKEHKITFHDVFDFCLQIDIEHLNKSAGILLNDTFWDATEKERERRWLKYWKIRKNSPKFCDACIGRGLYSLQIKSWLKEYGQLEFKDKNLIIKSESLRPDPTTKLIDFKPICEFIGIEEIFISDNDVHAPTVHSGPMFNETKVMLRNLFEPFNKELYSILGEGWGDPWPYQEES